VPLYDQAKAPTDALKTQPYRPELLTPPLSPYQPNLSASQTVDEAVSLTPRSWDSRRCRPRRTGRKRGSALGFRLPPVMASLIR
jgi:hypothetical protein